MSAHSAVSHISGCSLRTQGTGRCEAWGQRLEVIALGNGTIERPVVLLRPIGDFDGLKREAHRFGGIFVAGRKLNVGDERVLQVNPEVIVLFVAYRLVI